MKQQSYLNLPILGTLSYFYSFFLILFLTWLIYTNQPIFCDSCVESINDVTNPLRNYTFDNVSISGIASFQENINQDRFFFGDESDNESIQPKCSDILYKYKNIWKRKVFWYSCVKNKSAFSSYNSYKQSWDPNTKILREIRKEIKGEIEIELHKIRVTKRTINWFLNPSTRGRWS